MRSSTGQHWVALDHVRAFAAFLVFTWHFTHGESGAPVPFEGAPALFPLALLDEGHCGVALFMCLSGYLFAKLLDGREIDYKAFFWNRMVRLAPLLILVLLFDTILTTLANGSWAFLVYLRVVAMGFVMPFLPLDNGAWSIVIEAHFYVLLPLLLILSRRSAAALPLCLCLAVALRALLWGFGQDVQQLAYWTLIGRIDQFLLGMLAWRYRGLIARRHGPAALILVGFAAAYYAFDLAGGFFQAGPGVPSLLWVFWPTVEALGWASLIAYYDGGFTPRADGVSGAVARIGTYSYSIYLLHFYFVFRAAGLIDRHVMSLSNFYVACGWSLLCFAAMIPIGRLSYRCVEQPFLRLRRRYVREEKTPDAPEAVAQPAMA
jgi:peptidoglycan/LPS O-acetylase OafA/YrhL